MAATAAFVVLACGPFVAGYAGAHSPACYSGVYDLIAELEAASAAELNELIDRIGELAGVETTTSSILLATKWSKGGVSAEVHPAEKPFGVTKPLQAAGQQALCGTDVPLVMGHVVRPHTVLGAE
ncbi:MAG: Lrp/AsnC family transcriptional regulator [Gammaproteobacteria bacterium]|nr:Lrp/AsnC family transcriptional regulator [Gammaproteobacteria bacterium]